MICYRDLADSLKENYSVYGVQSPKLDDGSIACQDIESLSHYYLQKVKEIQPEGPYVFLGWSIGGLIAFEMAKQASENGEMVDKLILLDTYDYPIATNINDNMLLSLLLIMILNNEYLMTETHSWRISLVSSLMKYFKPTLNHPNLLLQLLGFKKTGLTAERIKSDIEKAKHDLFSLDPLSFPILEWMDIGRKMGFISADIDDKQVMLFYHVFRDNFYMSEHYLPGLYNGNIIYIAAAEHKSNNWQAHCKTLKTYVLPTNHYKMIKDKNSLSFIRKILNKKPVIG